MNTNRKMIHDLDRDHFGKIITGFWKCYNCTKILFPARVIYLFEHDEIKRVNDKFACPYCKELMQYDEEKKGGIIG